MMHEHDHPHSSPAQSLLEALDQLSHHINRQIYRQNHRRAAFGHGRGRVLRLLAAQDAMTQSAIAEAAQLRPPTVAELLEKLERDGYISRQRDTEDRRRTLVSITDSGREAIEQTHDLRTRFAEDLFSGLTEDEIATMLSITQKLNTQFHNEEDSEIPPMPPFGFPHPPHGAFPPPPPPFHVPHHGCGPRPPFPKPRQRPENETE